MKCNVQTLSAAVLVGSTALLVSTANGYTASSSSLLNVHSSDSQSSSMNTGQKVSLDQVPDSKKRFCRFGWGEPKDETNDRKRWYAVLHRNVRRKLWRKGKVTVDRDGSLVALQESVVFAADVDLAKLGKSQIDFHQLPMPVQTTIHDRAGTSPVGNLSKSEVNGQPIYRADFDRNGVRHELFITPQGQIAAQVREVTVASQWTFDENGNLVANPGRQINESAGAQAPQSDQNKTSSRSTGVKNSRADNRRLCGSDFVGLPSTFAVFHHAPTSSRSSSRRPSVKPAVSLHEKSFGKRGLSACFFWRRASPASGAL